MRNRRVAGLSLAKKLALGIAGMLVLIVPVVIGALNAVWAQEAPDWQTKAGGKMAFGVASVKPDKGYFVPRIFPSAPEMRIDQRAAFSELLSRSPFISNSPVGKARFDAHKAQYEALNKIYGTYFSPGKAPSRACMAVEWIPGDSLIEIVGSALVVTSPAPPPV